MNTHKAPEGLAQSKENTNYQHVYTGRAVVSRGISPGDSGQPKERTMLIQGVWNILVRPVEGPRRWLCNETTYAIPT